MKQKRFRIPFIALLLVGLPLLGVFLAGAPLARYLEFPPVTRYVKHAPFSWPFFIGTAVFIIGAVGPLLIRVLRHRVAPIAPGFNGSRSIASVAINARDATARLSSPKSDASDAPAPSPLTPHAFPWWGWLGLGITSLAWVLAWNRFPWLGNLQSHTFTPLWIGYILVINALASKRTGHCMMLGRPRYFLSLFLLSAAFWWFFEYLNRFVQNWYYVGASEFTATEYFWYATLPFSTVLPAVLSTRDWLATCHRLSAGLDHWWPMQVRQPTLVGWLVLVLAGVGLMGIGVWPDYLYPLLWVSPLLIITSLQAVSGEETVFSCISRGDWRPIWLPAFAALVCGLFWELWNYRSLAHWEYAVPFVHRFQIFEMPLLGYAGYLPFGLECVVIAGLLSSRGEPMELRA
ncbi:MAG: hypothetical protein E6K69_05470 [Nitrospirae bacterium]|nr:MAG: hypothetical protein E6K69_05470 [Nitrospirota bacterium]